MKKIISIISALLTFCLLGGVCVSATTVADLGSLEGKTLISWNDFYSNASATTGNNKGVLTRVTGAEGEYSTYLQYEVQGITTASENSRVLEYKDLDMAARVSAGDAMLLRMVVRAVDTAGKTKVTSLIAGDGTTSKPTGQITIPTQWTEIFVPMTAGGSANYFTMRFGYFNQTVQIADLSLVNYGSAATLTGESRAPVKGGTSVDTHMFANATQLIPGQTLLIEPVAAHQDDMVLLTVPVRGVGQCGKVSIRVQDTVMTYAVPVQWSNIYMPVKCSAALDDISVCALEGTVQIGTAVVENKGNATFEELALQSGMWLLEDFDHIVLKESQGVKANNEDFYAQKGITSGRTADLVISSDGKYVYSIGDGMLTVTDITADPKVVSKLQGFGDVAGTSTLGDTRQICLLPGKGTNGADAVIFTARSYGAFIFDMADPANPVELAHYDALEMATGLAVYGDYAFVCSRFYGVEVVDIADPTAPKHLCTILNEGGEVQSCKVVDGILYAGEYNNNCVSIYDVTDPLNYKKLGVCQLNGRGDGMTVATVGEKTYLYAGTGHHSVSGLANSTPLSNLSYGQGNGLDIFDVTDPANPKWLSTSKTDGRFYNTSCDFWGAEYAYDAATGKSYAYLVSTFNGMYVFDVTDPKAPVRVAHIALELLPDSPNYGAYGLTGSRAFIYNFDTTGENPVKYGAVGAVACIDGTICIAGVISDLYVLDYAKAFDTDTVSEDVAVAVSGDYYNFDAFSSMEGYASATVEGGQTYAVDTLGEYVYVAAGAKGIMIYDKELTLKGSLATEDICYDLYIQDGKMYTAEGRCGAAIYTVDGLTLTETWRCKSTVGAVTTVRPSATGKFVAVHVGAVTGQIIRVSDKNTVVSVKATSQMYHHNVTGLVDGRYMGFWANSSSERWYDFGENDHLDTPVRVTDSSSGYTPRAAMTGGITAYGDQAMATGNGGYYLYDPNTITSAEQAALTQTRPVDGYGSATKTNIYGKATVAGNMLISCDRIYGRIYITDISNINQPVRLAAFGIREGTALVGNPDIAKVDGNNVYIPLGYMGVVKFELSQFEPDGNVHTGAEHCLCCDNIKNHNCNDLTWQAWGDTEEERGKLPTSGNYYLVTDMTVGQTKITSGTLNLCLNGQTLTAKTGARIFHVSAGAKLNITDCRGSGELLATATTGAGGVIYLDADAASTASIYGGTLRGTVAINQNGGLIYSAGGTVNIHGGTLRDGAVVNNGTSVKRGGNIRVDGKGTLTITGGLITNGSATGITGTSGSHGGNIYISAGGTLNIGGGIIEKGTAGGDNGGNIYADSGATIHITGGIIRDGISAKRGYNIYVNSSASAPSTVNMSAGLVDFDETLTSTGLGGNIYINLGATFNLSGGTVKDGIAGTGGNIYMNIKSLLNMTGGTVEGGYASSNGGNVHINAAADMTMSGGTIKDGEAKIRGGNVFLAYNEEYQESYGRTDSTFAMTGGALQDGISKGNGGNLFVYYGCTATVSGTAKITGGEATSLGGNICGNNATKLYSNIYIYGADITGGSAGADGDNIYATGYLYLDLMGKDYTGVYATVSRMYGFDSATDGYDGAKAGKLTLENEDAVRSHWKHTDTQKRYLTIKNADGTYEFHRFYLGITKMSLRPGVTGVGYKAVFAGSEEVKQSLASYGYKLWLDSDNVAVAAKEGSSFTSLKELTLRLQHFDVENYGDTPIYGSVYMELTDGTVIESSTYQYTLKDLVELINKNVDGYSETQLTALKAMCQKWTEAMSGWSIDNILNYAA